MVGGTPSRTATANSSVPVQWFDKSSLLLTVTKHTALGHTEASTQLARGLPVSLVAGL